MESQHDQKGTMILNFDQNSKKFFKNEAIYRLLLIRGC